MENKIKKIEINWEKRAEEWQHKANDYLSGWQRAKADFINYKKRQEEIVLEFKKYVKEDFILEILPILDNFQEALKHVPENARNTENQWVKGILNIKDQLEGFLKTQGVEEIRTIGENFNPECHEAVEILESDRKTGTILKEGQRGYTLNGKVIRAARVKVAK